MDRRPNSLRARWHDYSSVGWYFVTICTAGRAERLGRIVDGRLRPSVEGLIALSKWSALEAAHPEIALDEWVLMPDHMHGIVRLRRRFDPGLSGLVASYKSATTLEANRILRTPGRRLWQRNFHDRIMRRARHLHRGRAYVRDNPRAWEERRHCDESEWMVMLDDPPEIGPDDRLVVPP